MGRHSGADVDAKDMQLVSFNVNDPATVWGVSSPENFISDVTVTNTAGPGRYDVTISKFLGPRGFAHVFPSLQIASAGATLGGVIVVTTLPTYSGDTLTFGIGINTTSGLGVRANFSCLVLAY